MTLKVADETLHLNPHAMEAPPEGPQLAMIHACVWTENPEGPFAQQNWALPFHRLDIPVPERLTPAAGKAAHLVSGGVEYYAEVIHRAGKPSADEMAAVNDVLRSSRDDVRSIIDVCMSDSATDVECVARLSAQWSTMWDELFRRLGPDVVEQLRPLSH